MAFSFENYERNENLNASGFKSPNATKTGTTICGILFKDGVVLGADTRSTRGATIAEKSCLKLHYLADHMYCCGAGTAADTEKVTSMISSQLELHRLLIGKQVPIIAATRMIRQHLFQYQGHIGAALILGGVDSTGSYIYSIHPHGSISKLNYTSMGSGCLAAISVLEREWKPNMELEDAKLLVRNAITAGIYEDLGSGNSVELCVIAKGKKAELLRKYDVPLSRPPKEKSYLFKPNSTAILSRTVIPIKVENTTVRQLDVEPMEVGA